MLFPSFKAVGLVSALLVLPPLVSATILPRASNTPGCSWTCPSKSTNGKNLESSEVVGGMSLKCVYGKPPGPETCLYWKSNGDRIGNNSKCPSKADQVCSLRRDVEGTYKAYQDQRERRAAAPAPTVPEYMYTRQSLKKREV